MSLWHERHCLGVAEYMGQKRVKQYGRRVESKHNFHIAKSSISCLSHSFQQLSQSHRHNHHHYIMMENSLINSPPELHCFILLPPAAAPVLSVGSIQVIIAAVTPHSIRRAYQRAFRQRKDELEIRWKTQEKRNEIIKGNEQ